MPLSPENVLGIRNEIDYSRNTNSNSILFAYVTKRRVDILLGKGGEVLSHDNKRKKRGTSSATSSSEITKK